MKIRTQIVVAAGLLVVASAAGFYGGGSSSVEPAPPRVPVPAADAAKFAETYYNVGVVSKNIQLTLKPDGSYLATWHGCLGVYGEASGNWRLSERTIVLSPFRETGVLEGFLRTLEILDEGKEPAFVRPEDRTHLKDPSDEARYRLSLRFWTFQRAEQVVGSQASHDV